MLFSAKMRHYALGLLARREHTQVELRQKLTAKGFVANDITPLLQELAAKKLQSDGRFITEYINMRTKRGFGPIKIGAELSTKGITKEQITNALHKTSDEDWLALAKNILYKKFGAQSKTNIATQAKQMRHLRYKGFSNNQINNILKYDNSFQN